jgi:hypothetical protein
MTLYPNAIDGYSSLPLRIDGVHEIRADDVNRLRNAIIAIEQELGIQPSGVFATIAARLDSVADAEALINSHLADTIDAHDASAISILDSGDNYISIEVEGALGELASILPASLDVIGANNTSIPNDGIPSFVSGSGTLHVFTTSGGANEVKKTQPVDVTGFHIIDVGENNGTGVGTLTFVFSPDTLAWTAPGDSIGTAVSVSSLSTGDIITLESGTTTKRIRVVRTSASTPTGNTSDTFDLIRLNAAAGTFSKAGVGFQNSNNITRTATNSVGTSRNQFMIGGMVYPADKGTLVLQRKLRLAADTFTPIATLDLKTNFTESLRATGQNTYTPALTGFDTITLFDRLPARKDYETLSPDADGNSVYSNFNLEATFATYQVAKYLIPASNSNIVNGELEAPTGITTTEIDKVSSYRVVHYKDGVTDFNGEPAAANIFSVSDAYGNVNDGDNTVRISNVYVDTNTTRPNIRQVVLRPVLDIEVTEKIISGIHYYNSSSDLFDVELITPNTSSGAPSETPSIFTNAYLSDNILRFATDVLSFPTGDGYGTNVSVEKMLDDGYEYFSAENLPTFSDYAFYLLNSTFLDAYRPSVDGYKYSNNANITATLYDPFGAGTSWQSYGVITPSGTDVRLLVNSFAASPLEVDGYSTNTRELFRDEAKRVGTTEVFDFELDANQFTYEDGVGTGGRLEDWDDLSVLSSGELQCGGIFTEPNSPGLVYPQDDYDPSTANIRPTQQSGTDYSGFSGDATYQRLFSIGVTTNGGRLRIKSSGSALVSFDDIDFNNSSRPVKIAVKIPGSGGNSTGFMDIGRLFETGEFDDDSGALSGTVTGTAGDFIVPFTFGTQNTSDTGNMIAVKITYLNAVLADAKTRIISLIELLEP